MTPHALYAHAEPGSVDLAGLIIVGAAIAAAATWLVVTIRRLDLKEHAMTEPDVKATGGRPAVPRWAQILVLGVVLAVLGAGGYLVFRSQSDLASAPPQQVVDDLCLAAEQADTDPDAALATFDGSPHDALHTLDSDLRQVDPLAAARIATTKADVEAALIARDSDAPELTRTLAEETAAAYRTLEDDDSITGCD